MKDPKSKTCKGCKGDCCRYIAMEIDTPKTKEDFEDLRWYVTHKNVNVYVEEDNMWNVEFITPCEFLDEDNQCTIYENRPEICKEYDHDECLFHNEYDEKHTFKTLKEIDEYIKKKFKK
jgi:hypothetical protein|tara:strand:+ start:2726 stop:3082 length:357 start_codon:yes stop_codon:yes gene_type:complete